MRELTQHIVEGDSANHQLKIEVTDEPGSGGANHRYEITGFGLGTNPSAADFHEYASLKDCAKEVIIFQNGPIKEVGVNGLTHEALMAIIIDQLDSFQNGPFRCEDNETALLHCREALKILQNRTRARIARGVEGTHAK